MSEPEITDDAVARLRARVGVPEPWTRRPHYLRPNTDAFRIVAEAYGDDNPLWCDPTTRPRACGADHSHRHRWWVATR